MNEILRDQNGRFVQGYEPTQFKKGHKPFIHTLTGLYKSCTECGKKIYVMPYYISSKKFCSKYCHALNQSKDPRIRLRGLELGKFTPKFRSNEWRRKISKALKGHPVSDKSREISRETCLNRIPRFRDTSIEVSVKQALLNKGIKNFACHLPIEKITQPDILFRKEKLAIFCDGDYWHSLPKVKLRDTLINKVLKSKGWKVLRLKERNIENSLDNCINKIIQHLRKCSN